VQGPVCVGLPDVGVVMTGNGWGEGVVMTGKGWGEGVVVYSRLMRSLVVLWRMSSARARALRILSFPTYDPGLFNASPTRVFRQASVVPRKWLQAS
jgi:hypothetical protein